MQAIILDNTKHIFDKANYHKITDVLKFFRATSAFVINIHHFPSQSRNLVLNEAANDNLNKDVS